MLAINKDEKKKKKKRLNQPVEAVKIATEKWLFGPFFTCQSRAEKINTAHDSEKRLFVLSGQLD